MRRSRSGSQQPSEQEGRQKRPRVHEGECEPEALLVSVALMCGSLCVEEARLLLDDKVRTLYALAQAAVDSRLVPLVASMRCTLNGKEMGTAFSGKDVTLRWRSLGLLGGAPKAQEDDKTKDVDEMKKDELMRYAKNVLGVETRTVGPSGKNFFPCGGGCEARLQGGAGQALPASAREPSI